MAAAAQPPPAERVVFVTGNANKLREVRSILGETVGGMRLEAQKVDLPELQGEPNDIAAEKVALAAREVGGPVMVEDTSLRFVAMGGLPGPYIKWFLDKLGHEGLNRMLQGFDSKAAQAVCLFAYTAGPGCEVHLFEGVTEGTIVPARGPTTFGWDPIFLPDGHEQTYAEMSKEDKNAISHRYRALQKLSAFFGAGQQ